MLPETECGPDKGGRLYDLARISDMTGSDVQLPPRFAMRDTSGRRVSSSVFLFVRLVT